MGLDLFLLTGCFYYILQPSEIERCKWVWFLEPISEYSATDDNIAARFKDDDDILLTFSEENLGIDLLPENVPSPPEQSMDRRPEERVEAYEKPALSSSRALDEPSVASKVLPCQHDKSPHHDLDTEMMHNEISVESIPGILGVAANTCVGAQLADSAHEREQDSNTLTSSETESPLFVKSYDRLSDVSLPHKQLSPSEPNHSTTSPSKDVACCGIVQCEASPKAVKPRVLSDHCEPADKTTKHAVSSVRVAKPAGLVLQTAPQQAQQAGPRQTDASLPFLSEKSMRWMCEEAQPMSFLASIVCPELSVSSNERCQNAERASEVGSRSLLVEPRSKVEARISLSSAPDHSFPSPHRFSSSSSPSSPPSPTLPLSLPSHMEGTSPGSYPQGVVPCPNAPSSATANTYKASTVLPSVGRTPRKRPIQGSLRNPSPPVKRSKLDRIVSREVVSSKRFTPERSSLTYFVARSRENNLANLGSALLGQNQNQDQNKDQGLSPVSLAGKATAKSMQNLNAGLSLSLKVSSSVSGNDGVQPKRKHNSSTNGYRPPKVIRTSKLYDCPQDVEPSGTVLTKSTTSCAEQAGSPKDRNHGYASNSYDDSSTSLSELSDDTLADIDVPDPQTKEVVLEPLVSYESSTDTFSELSDDTADSCGIAQVKIARGKRGKSLHASFPTRSIIEDQSKYGQG
eukprot:CAMPEP_0184537200 /NCGR_PEP_ID=MMETSP0198_2-20121128/16896_1 /TAXON_ID=1112570 /ORGANISM="Thraustochytrium sp., Strain LLF1b" /LENGTH=684 /DNA_ID=CAMNT_0026930493 /DNA_START=84 /DNA_END=2140 /DNA_ORIENTATION=-